MSEPKFQSPDENCAYAVGKAAGEFLRLKRSLDSLDSSYGSAASLLTYSRYDKRVLDSIVIRIGKSIGILLTKGNKKNEVEKARSEIAKSIKDCEITDAGRDYAYFFHRGALANIWGAS